MAENLLTDARVRAATFERDGAYLRDGGGLRIRLLPPSRKHPTGAKLPEFHFSLRQPDGRFKQGAIGLGTLGQPFIDPADGNVRPFGLRDARKARDVARLQVKAGLDPRDVRKVEQHQKVADVKAKLEARRTVQDAFDGWHKQVAARHKDKGALVERTFAVNILPTLGPVPLDCLTRSRVMEVIDAVKARGRLRTSSVVLQAVRALIRWAMLREWIEKDVTAGITVRDAGGRAKPRDRILNAAEIKELHGKLSCLPDHAGIAVLLLLATATRCGELAAAKVCDFDLETREWHIPDTKSGRPHLVHLSDFAIRQVKRLTAMNGGSAYLVPSRDPKKPLAAGYFSHAVAARQCDQPADRRTPKSTALILARGTWTPHDLRRTAASLLRQELRVSSDVVELVLNHKPQGIVAVYQTSELLDERREALVRWGDWLDRLLPGDGIRVRPLTRRRRRVRLDDAEQVAA